MIDFLMINFAEFGTDTCKKDFLIWKIEIYGSKASSHNSKRSFQLAK